MQARLRAYQAKQAVHELRLERRRGDNLLWTVLAIVLGGALIAAQVLYFTLGPAAPQPGRIALGDDGVPLAAAAESKTWTGSLTLNGTELGFELDGAAAPQAVASFLYLASTDFYPGTDCHRLTTRESFRLLQCGDPNGNGSGGPGYSYGPVENAPADNRYPAGTIAMARQGGNAESMGSQFFIVYEDTVLPADAAGGYTVFGRVTEGLDAFIADIASIGVLDDDLDGAPVTPITIRALTVDDLVG